MPTMDDINDAAFNFDAYSEFLQDAEKDDRVGDHTFLVTQVTDDQWPSGDPRRKILGTLVTARNAKADLTISPPPPPDVLKAESATMEPGKKKAIANTITLYKQFAQHYGKSPMQVREGEEYRVKTVKTRRNDDGTGGFIRIVAILSPQKDTNSVASSAPF